jgi:serine phosphatase RsbU (regulator of sigma subunit)
MDDAISSYNQAYEFAKSFNDSRGMATALIGIARIDLKVEKFKESEENARKALQIVEKVGDKVYEKDSYEVLVNIAKATKSYEAAVAYQDKFLALQEEIYNDKLSKDINYLTKSFQDEQNKAHIDLLQQQQQTTNIIIVLVALGLIVSSIFSVFLFRNNKKLNKTQSDLKVSMDTIAKKNEDIEASIRYASRIQKAFLPNRFELNVALPNNFIFYKPKNVVGGDFYFFREIDKKIFLAVADCTGHGVPGALLSIVGSMALQKVILDNKVRQADKILEEVHDEMRRALRQSQDGGGMEIAMCVIDHEKNTLEIASARTPVYIFQNDMLHVVEGERMMVGDTKVETMTFQNHIYSLKDIKKIYMASDGLQDQFSSNNNKKFTKKGFKDLLHQIQEKPIQLQGQELESILKSWQGEETQTDDILVMGIEI